MLSRLAVFTVRRPEGDPDRRPGPTRHQHRVRRHGVREARRRRFRRPGGGIVTSRRLPRPELRHDTEPGVGSHRARRRPRRSRRRGRRGSGAATRRGRTVGEGRRIVAAQESAADLRSKDGRSGLILVHVGGTLDEAAKTASRIIDKSARRRPGGRQCAQAARSACSERSRTGSITISSSARASRCPSCSPCWSSSSAVSSPPFCPSSSVSRRSS